MWMIGARKSAANLTCVWCRAKWTVAVAASAGAGGASRSVEGYLNLGRVAGIDTERDTSTCAYAICHSSGRC